MSVAELAQHIKDLKKESKKQAKRKQKNGKVGGSNWVEKQYKDKKSQQQQPTTIKIKKSKSIEGSIQKLIEQAEQPKPKNKPQNKTTKQKIKKKQIKSISHEQLPIETSISTSTTTTASIPASSAAERLVTILASFKALKLCIEAGGDPTNPDSVGYEIPTENEIALGLSFIRKQVTTFETRAWAVARAGGVGSIAVLVYHYVTVRVFNNKMF